MKKKSIIIGIIVVIAAILCIWLFIRPKELGSINHTASKPETANSDFTFSGESGDKIRISFASDIKSGDLDIIIYDSNGDVVKYLDKAKVLKTFMTLEHSDTYTLTADYKNFIGDFKIFLYKWK